MDDANQGVESGVESLRDSLYRASAAHIVMTSYTKVLTRSQKTTGDVLPHRPSFSVLNVKISLYEVNVACLEEKGRGFQRIDRSGDFRLHKGFPHRHPHFRPMSIALRAFFFYPVILIIHYCKTLLYQS